MRSPEQALDEPHVTPNEMAYWTDFILCILNGAHGNSSASKIMTVRHILCDEPFKEGEDMEVTKKNFHLSVGTI